MAKVKKDAEVAITKLQNEANGKIDLIQTAAIELQGTIKYLKAAAAKKEARKKSIAT